MAKKPAASSASTPSKPTPATTTTHNSPPQTSSKPSSSLSPKASPQEVAVHVWNEYLQNTPARTFLLDAFMAFLVLIGGIQFLYAVLFGNYPFNAFLSGFSAAVGQFVLTASLRLQTTERSPPAASSSAEAKKAAAFKKFDATSGEVLEERESGRVSSERAFADYLFGSLILHGFCVNFIN